MWSTEGSSCVMQSRTCDHMQESEQTVRLRGPAYCLVSFFSDFYIRIHGISFIVSVESCLIQYLLFYVVICCYETLVSNRLEYKINLYYDNQTSVCFIYLQITFYLSSNDYCELRIGLNVGITP